MEKRTYEDIEQEMLGLREAYRREHEQVKELAYKYEILEKQFEQMRTINYALIQTVNMLKDDVS